MKQIAVVTGCAGFIGITLTRKLLESGWNVYGVDKLTYVANTDELLSLEIDFRESFNFVDSDICELDRLPECDVVFNLAAESDVDNSILNIDSFIKSNIDGVKNLLRLITHNSVQNKHNMPLFFHMSTDEVYGDIEEGSFDEKSPLNPSNPYSATKAAADMIIQAWSRTYKLEYILARPSNNYGYHQYPEKLIPTAVRRLMRGKKIKLHNEGKPIRSWTHSEDTADAMILIYEKGRRNSIYNIQANFEQTNFETVKKIINFYFMGSVTRDVPDLSNHIDYTYGRPGQDIRYSITCKPLEDLGWKPKKEFDVHIPELINHYKQKRWVW